MRRRTHECCVRLAYSASFIGAASCSQAFTCRARLHRGAKIGSILGISYAAGAVINLVIPPITAYVLIDLEGDWSVVNWGFLLSCVPQFGVVLWLGRSVGASSSGKAMV